MIFHGSIPADEPERVAKVIAELWRCEYFPFIFPNNFLILSNDDRGSALETGPRGEGLIPGGGAVDRQIFQAPSSHSECHFNIATPLSFLEVQVIAEREGWLARICDRGGVFNVIEFWLENKFMLELMTDHELTRYQSIMNPEFWRGMSVNQPPQSAPHIGSD
jgi:hypothetical protein